MNKQDLIDAVATKTGASKAQTGETLDALLEAIKKQVSRGDAVQLIGFGSFGSGKRAARTGRNPKTGETIKIPAAKTVRSRTSGTRLMLHKSINVMYIYQSKNAIRNSRAI